MPDSHIICKHLNGQDADLVTLARRAGEVHRFLEVAHRHGLSWKESLEGDRLRFSVAVPTDRLEGLVSDLRRQCIAFGTIDDCTRTALGLARERHVEYASRQRRLSA